MSRGCSETLESRLAEFETNFEEWGREHRDVSLAEVERGVLQAMRALLPDLVRAMVERCTSALSTPVNGLRQPCPVCHKRRKSHQWREREVLTVCG